MSEFFPTGGASIFSASCPSRQAFEIIADKWALLLIAALYDGPVRNNELLRRLEGVSQKMMTQTLRSLQAANLVIRTDHNSVPPHVDYRLSELGRSLSDTLRPLDRWVENNYTRMQLT